MEYKTDSKTETETYYYGNGLIYENSSEVGIIVYHYNHLGSTTAVTDGEGKLVYGFDYGTYGELVSTTEYGTTTPIIRFLYNGQLGVATDDNGLYYMRNRYYNPDIKRFINQDILTGSIGNSASLNRYSYVEGNPVSYTDPFGLSPYGNFGTFLNVMNVLSKLDKSAIIHTALDILGAMPGGSWFDMANAALYFMEGNYTEFRKALLFALPGADIAGKGAKFAAWLGGNGKEFIEAVAKGIDLGTHFLAICQSASDFGTAAAKMIDKYMVNEAELSWQTAVELFVLVGTGYQLGAFSKSYLDKVYSMFDMKEFSSSSSDLTKPVTNDKNVADDINYRDNVNTNSSTQDNSYTNSQAHQTCLGDNTCFVAGTEIKTDEGYRNIEDIHAGDLVYAKNTETGEEGYKEVVRVFVKESDELIYLTVGDEEITTTPSHPFYVVDKGFVEAVELEIGDEVETADGERLFVTDIRYEYLDVPVTVYNFEVADWHTYYVSDEDVLVHNVCGETILPTEATHEAARNALLNEIAKTDAFKYGSNKYIGRMESSYGYGKQIGRQSLDGKVRWRLDYDDKIGVHYNFEDFSKGKGANAIKKVIPIDISYDEYVQIIDSWN